MGRVTSLFLSRCSYVLGDVDIKYSITYRLFWLSVAKQLFNLLVLPTRHQPRSQFLSPTSLSQQQGRVGDSMRREPRERGWLLFPGRSHAVLTGGRGTMRDSDPNTQTLGHGRVKRKQGGRRREIYYFLFCFLSFPSVVSFFRSSYKLTALWAIFAFPNLPLS